MGNGCSLTSVSPLIHGPDGIHVEEWSSNKCTIRIQTRVPLSEKDPNGPIVHRHKFTIPSGYEITVSLYPHNAKSLTQSYASQKDCVTVLVSSTPSSLPVTSLKIGFLLPNGGYKILQTINNDDNNKEIDLNSSAFVDLMSYSEYKEQYYKDPENTAFCIFLDINQYLDFRDKSILMRRPPVVYKEIIRPSCHVSLWKKKHFIDCVVKHCSDLIIPVHQFVLAQQSPIFLECLTQSNPKSLPNCIDLSSYTNLTFLNLSRFLVFLYYENYINNEEEEIHTWFRTHTYFSLSSSNSSSRSSSSSNSSSRSSSSSNSLSANVFSPLLSPSSSTSIFSFHSSSPLSCFNNEHKHKSNSEEYTHPSIFTDWTSLLELAYVYQVKKLYEFCYTQLKEMSSDVMQLFYLNYLVCKMNDSAWIDEIQYKLKEKIRNQMENDAKEFQLQTPKSQSIENEDVFYSYLKPMLTPPLCLKTEIMDLLFHLSGFVTYCIQAESNSEQLSLKLYFSKPVKKSDLNSIREQVHLNIFPNLSIDRIWCIMK